MSKLCDECETVAHCLKHGCVPKIDFWKDYEPEPTRPAPVQEHVFTYDQVKAHIQAAMMSAAQRQWVGLSDEDLANCSGHEVRWALYWEKLLKGKNT